MPVNLLKSFCAAGALAALLAGAAPSRLAAGQVGCLYALSGPVELRKAGTADWLPALKGRPLGQGDAVRTGAGAWCELLFSEGSFIKLEENSEAAAETLLVTAAERSFSFSFLKGRALWMARKLKKTVQSKFSVRTPSAVCAVRGTDFSILVSTAGETSVGLFEGEVALSDKSGEKVLPAGGEAAAGPAGLTVEGRLSKLMKAEERRYRRVKKRVEDLRRRLAAREDFIDDYIRRQDKALADFEKRRQEKLNKK